MEENNYSKQGWTAILTSMADHDLDFVVVGGAAMALHGLPRTTLDIDVYIPATTIEFEKLFHCLVDVLGLSSEQSVFRKHSATTHLFKGQWFTFSNDDGIDVVDVFLDDSTQHNILKKSSNVIDFANHKILIASLDELKRMKLDCARPIDLADVELINEIIGTESR